MNRLTLLLASTAIGLTSCGTTSPSFRADGNLGFQTPRQESTVAVPVRIEWRDKPPAPGASFAVFVDRAPIRPGANITSVAHGDASCVPEAGCPDAAYLNGHNVYVTVSPALVVGSVTKSLTGHRGADRHHVTVVRLDANQQRVGEAAATVTFFVPRHPPSAPAQEQKP
jgi:hypothetical protein